MGRFRKALRNTIPYQNAKEEDFGHLATYGIKQSIPHSLDFQCQLPANVLTSHIGRDQGSTTMCKKLFDCFKPASRHQDPGRVPAQTKPRPKPPPPPPPQQPQPEPVPVVKVPGAETQAAAAAAAEKSKNKYFNERVEEYIKIAKAKMRSVSGLGRAPTSK